MSQPISESEATQHLGDYLDRVIRNGESFAILRGDKPIAELQPLPIKTPVPKCITVADLPAFIASLPKFSPDEAEAFARDLEEGQALMNQVEEFNGWDT